MSIEIDFKALKNCLENEHPLFECNKTIALLVNILNKHINDLFYNENSLVSPKGDMVLSYLVLATFTSLTELSRRIQEFDYDNSNIIFERNAYMDFLDSDKSQNLIDLCNIIAEYLHNQTQENTVKAPNLLQ